MNLHDLHLRLRALLAPGRVDRELDDELAFHIERETAKHAASGLKPADARARALARFGPVPLSADGCRDARGTSLVDTLVRDISYAFRTFSRAPLAALTIVLTVGLGLGLVALVFTFYNAFFLRVDAVQDPGELFAVTRPARPGADAWMPFTRAEYEALRRETGVFAGAVAMVRSVETRIEGRPVGSTLVTGNFFQVLGVHAALGRTLTPADDEPSAGRAIVLSHRGWIRLFAGDPAVVGRSVPVNGVPCEVVGVMPERFRGLGLGPPDYWAPLALAGDLRQTYAGREGDMPVDDVVGRLRAGVTLEQAAAGLTVWASGLNLKTAGERPASIRLTPRQGTLSADWHEVLAVFAPIFFAFGLILMIGCANVANLLLARGVARQREIGIRLSLGASRRRVIRQLLTESLILALAAAACGFAVSRMLLGGALYALTTTMPAEIAEGVNLVVPSADWRVLVFLAAGAIASTVFFGLVPALQATRIELVRAMRGELTRDARPARARHALIAVQVCASALLLICAAVFLRSASAAARVDPGIRTSDTVTVPIANEGRRAAILRELAAHPSVVAVSAESSAGLAPASVVDEAAADPAADDSAAARRSVPVDYKFVSPEYLHVLDIALLRGRGFTGAERTAEAGVAIVSEGAARRLWPNGEALGQTVRMPAHDPADVRRPGALPPPPRAYTVVGIVRDVGSASVLFEFFSFSGVYLPADPHNPGTSLTLRVRGDPEQARRALLDRLTRIDPALDHEVRTLRTMAGLESYVLRIAFSVTLVLGALALALTVSGLFSVLSYLVEGRAREIGVRMALGATTRGVAVLVLSQLVRPVGLGLLAGGGLAAALAMVLVSNASEIGDTVRVLDPLAYAGGMLVIVASCALAVTLPALRAARIDPIATLRND